jgi:tRNA A-37 threonylcarbamoyl transferase component Bud32
MAVNLQESSKCIKCCEEKSKKEMYQNIAIEYSKELKQLKEVIEKEYQIKLCCHCQ